MFNGLWPAFDEAEVPIGSITNGVHAPTWVAREVVELAADQGADPDSDDTEAFWAAVDKVPGADDLGDQARCCASGSSTTPASGCASPGSSAGPPKAELGWIDDRARPRRADDRLRAPRAVVQAADADAARPRAAQAPAAAPRAPDPAGHRRQGAPRRRRRQEAHPGRSCSFADDPEVRHRIVFLPNYDIAMAQPLYPGCDVWLNNPLRPLRGVRHLRA